MLKNQVMLKYQVTCLLEYMLTFRLYFMEHNLRWYTQTKSSNCSPKCSMFNSI